MGAGSWLDSSWLGSLFGGDTFSGLGDTLTGWLSSDGASTVADATTKKDEGSFLADLFSGSNLATLGAAGLGAFSSINQADAALGDKEADRQFQREMLAQEMAFKREMAALGKGEGGANRALQAEIARRQLQQKAYETLITAALSKGGMVGGALDSLTQASQAPLLRR